MGRLDGKICVITGAASGIALGAARAFVREGAVVGLLDRNADGLAVVLLHEEVKALRLAKIERHEERLPPSSAGHRDWHNDYAELLLEINDTVEAAADRKAKGVIIRRIRDALRDEARS